MCEVCCVGCGLTAVNGTRRALVRSYGVSFCTSSRIFAQPGVLCLAFLMPGSFTAFNSAPVGRGGVKALFGRLEESGVLSKAGVVEHHASVESGSRRTEHGGGSPGGWVKLLTRTSGARSSLGVSVFTGLIATLSAGATTSLSRAGEEIA